MPLGARVAEPLRLTGFQQRGDGVDIYLADQWVDRPRLPLSIDTAGGAGDIPRQRPHRGIRRIGGDEADAVADAGAGRGHQGEGAAHAGAEQAAPRRVDVRPRQQRHVGRGDVLDVGRVQAEVPHRGRPVQQRGEARARQRLTQAGDLRVIDAERHDAQADRNTGVRAGAGRPVEIALGLAVRGAIAEPLHHRMRRHPVQRPRRQHGKHFEQANRRLRRRARWSPGAPAAPKAL